MRYFKIPVEWAVYATVEIEAETIEEAVKKFDETIDEILLPTEADYIEDTFKRCIQDTEDLENNIAYYQLFN